MPSRRFKPALFQDDSDISASRATHETVVTRFDKQLLGVTLALVAFGLVSVYTASADQALSETGFSFSIVLKQAVSMVVGFVAMIFASRVSFTFWRKTGLLWAGVAIVLLLLTMVAGTTVNGSERWIMLPFGFQFQPSDFAKIAAIILLAQISNKNRFMTGKTFLHGGLVVVMMLLIYQQPNLSVTLILGMLTVAAFFMAGVPYYLFLTCLPFMGSLLYDKIMHTEYQRRRIEGWLDPWKDPMDTGYNLIQSYFAISGGGLFGMGLGASVQKLYYLPFQYTDFIFSVICEEWGFVGALIVIGLFAVLAWRGFSIAVNCPNRFGQMLAFGLTLAIILQASINICVTVGLMPVTGVTLPLISYGGTSMVFTLLMIGILLNISRYRLTARMPES